MIDDGDVLDVALIFSPRSPVGCLVFFIAVAITAWLAFRNTNECEAKKCATGEHAELLEGRCLCVVEAPR